jgi:hypothetical protein
MVRAGQECGELGDEQPDGQRDQAERAASVAANVPTGELDELASELMAAASVTESERAGNGSMWVGRFRPRR